LIARDRQGRLEIFLRRKSKLEIDTEGYTVCIFDEKS
jgi:hypothetical protein